MTLSVGLFGLEMRDEALLRSMLGLLSGRLPHSLLLSGEGSGAQAVLCPIGKKTLLHDLSAEQVVIWIDNGRNASAHDLSASDLRFVLRRPFGITDLARALHLVSEVLPPGAPQRTAATGARSLFNALVEGVRSEDSQRTVMAFKDGRRIMIDPQRNTVVSEPSWKELLDGLGHDSGMSVLPNDPTLEPALATSHLIPLESLLWDLAHQSRSELGCDGRLSQAQGFRLRRWPDSAALTKPHYARMAALMSVRSRSISELQHLSGVDVEVATRFVEAAVACGIAVAEANVPVSILVGSEHVTQRDKRTVFSRIRKHLKLW
ncbi:hypothetical protein [Hydrogenophaga sp.]|uniref:hypothetical protein n=1 Tax=Hydrogenophaga sp. TaxID=1904254 RepID=UPI003D13BD36